MSYRDEDAEVIAAARAGDFEVIDRLLALHQRQLYAVCWRMLGDRTDALDALQESMIKIAHGLPHFKGDSKVSTWMHRVTVNACLDEKRRLQRHRHSELTEDVIPTAQPTDQTQLTKMEIDAALLALNPDFRAVIVMRHILGHDYQLIAETLDIPVGTVRSRLSRARAELVRRLRNETES